MYLSKIPKTKSDKAITLLSGPRQRKILSGKDMVSINVNKALEKAQVPDYERRAFRDKIESLPKIERLNPEMLCVIYMMMPKFKKSPDEDLRQAKDLRPRLQAFFEDQEQVTNLLSLFFVRDEVEKDLRAYEENMLRYVRYLTKHIYL